MAADKIFQTYRSQIKILRQKKLHSVPINDILRKMGFPQNWQDIKQ